ncbi:MAG: adenine deaminase [Cyclobacteriaceae bacterium]|nr:adenine deaminase [Cyclobacteriaceae bacterium]MCH8515447.1 adenine deaminase [Cyclobacteriaceae bacterium]
MRIEGQIVDIKNKSIQPGFIVVKEGKIVQKGALASAPDRYIMPGFVDAHVHVESSMLLPTEFARLAVRHGTVGTVSDPHEIANVLGVAGVEYMIRNAEKSPFHFYFGAPSCVPATAFETAGAVVTPADIDYLFKKFPKITYLAEVMNWPGVINGDPDMLEKIALAKKHDRQVDGHAPGLLGEEAERYVKAGISTDHECFTLEEAKGKLSLGMKILIREGSAAKNFEALHPLLHEHSQQMMFCSDDKHPDNLRDGHINELAARAVANGVDVFKVLYAACIHPVVHYRMQIGLLDEGDAADFIVCKDLKDFQVEATYLQGELVAEKGESLLPHVNEEAVNQFFAYSLQAEDFELNVMNKLRVIVPEDGQLITKERWLNIDIKQALTPQLQAAGVLKLAVVNRYAKAGPAVSFIDGFDISEGAIASTVAHDSHNIIAAGTSDELLAEAVNALMECGGGVAVVHPTQGKIVVPLPVAGLMSTDDGWSVAAAYEEADRLVKTMGCRLAAPFMTLSFMALLVIPELKLSDKGLFDGRMFEFVPTTED